MSRRARNTASPIAIATADERSEQEEPAGLTGRIGVDRLREQQDRRAAGGRGEWLRDEDDAVAPAGLLLAREECVGVEIVDVDSRRELEQAALPGASSTTLLSPPRPSVTSPSGVTVTSPPFVIRRVDTEKAAERSAARPSRLAGAQSTTELFELTRDPRCLLLELRPLRFARRCRA